MAGTENKIRFGLKNVHYAPATIAADGSATYGTPVPVPGAVSLTLDPEGDRTPFYADNIEYWVDPGNTGYSGTLEMALFPDAFRKDVFGEIEDANGVLYEDQNAEAKHFALLFQFEGDKKARRHVFYNCTAARPSTTGATKEATVTPQTESSAITATSIYIEALDKNVVKGTTEAGGAKYDDWFTTVVLPAAAATNP